MVVLMTYIGSLKLLLVAGYVGVVDDDRTVSKEAERKPVLSAVGALTMAYLADDRLRAIRTIALGDDIAEMGTTETVGTAPVVLCRLTVSTVCDNARRRYVDRLARQAEPVSCSGGLDRWCQHDLVASRGHHGMFFVDEADKAGRCRVLAKAVLSATCDLRVEAVEAARGPTAVSPAISRRSARASRLTVLARRGAMIFPRRGSERRNWDWRLVLVKSTGNHQGRPCARPSGQTTCSSRRRERSAGGVHAVRGAGASPARSFGGVKPGDLAQGC
ncbi:hypothetical protein NL676_036903 [Syzygium grande]|nr:hypothetical protein NL676_036903 [Syzygium grande]